MSVVHEFGDLDDLDERSECSRFGRCETDAVVRMPGLGGFEPEQIDLCPYHLALWIDVCEGDTALKHAKRLAVTDHIPSRALLSLEDLPERIHNGKLRRIGIDHTGSGHYIERESASKVILVDARLDTSGSCELGDDRELSDWIDMVEVERGWVAIDPTVFEGVRTDA